MRSCRTHVVTLEFSGCPEVVAMLVAVRSWILGLDAEKTCYYRFDVVGQRLAASRLSLSLPNFIRSAMHYVHAMTVSTNLSWSLWLTSRHYKQHT